MSSADPDPREAPEETLRLQQEGEGGLRYCNRCGEPARALEGGICMRCRSLVAAKTLPLLNGDVDRLGLSGAGDGGEAEPDRHRVDPLIGMLVADRYRIVDSLGRGGMGVVYKVEHARIGKLLAMKLLAGELSRNTEVVRRFKMEALTSSKLSSPNTVQVFDYGATDGLTYLVMELVNGDDLGRLLKLHGALPPARVGRIVVQIANSLTEAHAAGIVHRDIKPENVMILKARDATDIAKVLDFGLAKLREGAELSEMTSQGAIVGTPYFMSPEQIRGEPVDNRSDIYSLGALMYRALTGVYPFNGPSPMSVFAKHLTEPPVPPHEVLSSVPVGFSDIVLRALEKDPADRFQRVEDMQAAVLAELTELGTSGIETLLDSGALRRLAKPVQAAEAVDAPALATRNEVEAYERKLRRTRIGVSLLIAAVPLAGLGAGAHYLLKERPLVFGGQEHEPNNEVAEANAIPYGDQVHATLGKRVATTEGDIDFFTVEVPARDKPSSLVMTSLPNIPQCLQIFQKGQLTPTAQFCSGRAGLDIEIPALKIEPGPYVLAVIQDLDKYGEDRLPFVHENVSDEYLLRLGPAEVDSSFESEPNDDVNSAASVALDQTVRGTLGWVHDQDVICPNLATSGFFRFRIDDDAREGASVLAATLLQGGAEGRLVRVHADRQRKPSPNDAATPFSGFTFQGTSPPCLVLRATVDPSASKRPDAVPRGSKAQYRVTLEQVP